MKITLKLSKPGASWLLIQFEKSSVYWWFFGNSYQSLPNDPSTYWWEHFLWVREAYQGILFEDRNYRGDIIHPWWLQDIPAPDDDYDPMPF